MLTLRLNARSSISALLTVKEVFPSTVSSAQTEPSSIRTTSSVIGGLTSTAPKLKLLLLRRMLNLPLLERKLLHLLIKHLMKLLLLMLATLLLLLPLLNYPPMMITRLTHPYLAMRRQPPPLLEVMRLLKKKGDGRL